MGWCMKFIFNYFRNYFVEHYGKIKMQTVRNGRELGGDKVYSSPVSDETTYLQRTMAIRHWKTSGLVTTDCP